MHTNLLLQVPNLVVPTPHIALPTFLVGWGGLAVVGGIAVSNNNNACTSDIIASELSSYGSSSDYPSYLLDARNAVRYEHLVPIYKLPANINSYIFK